MVSENGGPAAITSAIDPSQSDDEFPSLGVSRIYALEIGVLRKFMVS